MFTIDGEILLESTGMVNSSATKCNAIYLFPPKSGDRVKGYVIHLQADLRISSKNKKYEIIFVYFAEVQKKLLTALWFQKSSDQTLGGNGI